MKTQKETSKNTHMKNTVLKLLNIIILIILKLLNNNFKLCIFKVQINEICMYVLVYTPSLLRVLRVPESVQTNLISQNHPETPK